MVSVLQVCVAVWWWFSLHRRWSSIICPIRSPTSTRWISSFRHTASIMTDPSGSSSSSSSSTGSTSCWSGWRESSFPSRKVKSRTWTGGRQTSCTDTETKAYKGQKTNEHSKCPIIPHSCLKTWRETDHFSWLTFLQVVFWMNHRFRILNGRKKTEMSIKFFTKFPNVLWSVSCGTNQTPSVCQHQYDMTSAPVRTLVQKISKSCCETNIIWLQLFVIHR